MERIVVRHLSGRKTHQVEEFPLETTKELLIGRDPSAAIRFDPEHDDLVGRQHAKIVRDAAERYKFTITDLNSRNGTFVNRQRVSGVVALTPGDVIQMGPGGPEVQFEIDPPPADFVKATRLAATPVVLPPTREAGLAPTATSADAPKVAVGKATVERMVTQARSDAKKSVFGTAAGIVAVLGIAIAAVGWYLWGRTTQVEDKTRELAAAEANKPWTPEAIATNFTESTVFIEVGWKLVLAGTGEQIYHEYYVATDKNGQPQKNEQGQEVPPLPVYVQLPDGKVEPSLTLERGQKGQNQAIGGRHTGSGFVITSDGFILTNRHVSASWETSYSFPGQPGLLVKLGDQNAKPQVIQEPPSDWVPAGAKVIGRAITGKNVEGSSTYMDVTFAKNKLRFPATLTRVSDTHDVAMIKVDTPQPVKKVDLLDNYTDARVGQAIHVMGYPGLSPTVAVRTQSDDPFARDAQVRTVPDPTLTPGTIGRIIRGQMKPSGGQAYDYMSEYGDAYQLTVNATGPGNSGGPVFDDRGRVIAVYTSGKQDPRSGARISFAVPIRYGLELMGTKPVI